MSKESALAVFEEYQIRRIYDEASETWFFSVVDVVSALTDSVNARDYWFKMKTRVQTEDGFELSTICRQLKLISSDGKKYATDCADVQGLLRIIQSVPSPGPGILAAARAEREVDSAADDGAGNPQQADRLLERA